MSHLHIPTLHELALDVAADGVVVHGKQGLSRPMNRPLYYRCIQTYAQKHDDSMRMIKLFHRATSAGDIGTVPTLPMLVTLTDHCGMVEDYMMTVGALLSIADDDVDSVIECMHRLAARCMTAGKHQVLMDTMKVALLHTPCRAIRDVIVKYGGYLDPDDRQSRMCMRYARCHQAGYTRQAVVPLIVPRRY